MSVKKTILVTGASTGIGRAISLRFARERALIFITARRRKELEKTKQLIEKENGQTEIIVADLSLLDSINQLIHEIKNKTNTLDAIINVAGVWHGQKDVYADKDYQEFNQKVILDTLSVGTTAPMLLVHGLLPLMEKNSSVINISGTFESGAKGWLPYYVSKKAIEDFTIGLSEELKDKKIKVNCISPSDTATTPYKKFFPEYIKDAISPKEIAKQVVKLSLSTKTGKIIVVKKDKEPFESFHY